MTLAHSSIISVHPYRVGFFVATYLESTNPKQTPKPKNIQVIQRAYFDEYEKTNYLCKKNFVLALFNTSFIVNLLYFYYLCAQSEFIKAEMFLTHLGKDHHRQYRQRIYLKTLAMEKTFCCMSRHGLRFCFRF